MADIEPGDLLFYGPGGDEHVAMYVGGGSMIEAPYTGASVWITGVRTARPRRRRPGGLSPDDSAPGPTPTGRLRSPGAVTGTRRMAFGQPVGTPGHAPVSCGS